MWFRNLKKNHKIICNLLAILITFRLLKNEKRDTLMHKLANMYKNYDTEIYLFILLEQDRRNCPSRFTLQYGHGKTFFQNTWKCLMIVFYCNYLIVGYTEHNS